MLCFRLAVPVQLLLFATCAFSQTGFQHYRNSIAPYVVSPQEIVDRMLEIADLKPNETLYDLGSGDGRILLTAAQRFRAKAVGVEISDSLVRTTNEKIAKLNLQNRASVIHGDCSRWTSAPPTWSLSI